MGLTAFRVRLLDHHCAALRHAPGVVACSRPAPETYRGNLRDPLTGGRTVARIATDFVYVTAFVDGKELSDGPWTAKRVGTSTPGHFLTYVPPDRCSRGHAPLRYASTQACCYCVRQRRRGRDGWVEDSRPWTWVRVPLDQLPCAEAICSGLDWRVLDRKRPYGGFAGLRLELASGQTVREAAKLFDAMGWVRSEG